MKRTPNKKEKEDENNKPVSNVRHNSRSSSRANIGREKAGTGNQNVPRSTGTERHATGTVSGAIPLATSGNTGRGISDNNDDNPGSNSNRERVEREPAKDRGSQMKKTELSMMANDAMREVMRARNAMLDSRTLSDHKRAKETYHDSLKIFYTVITTELDDRQE